MEAKNAVMSGTELHELWIGLNVATEDMYKIAETQAEISFKAGVGKVVEWINDTDIMIMLSPMKRRDWQAKLREWGNYDIGVSGNIKQM